MIPTPWLLGAAVAAPKLRLYCFSYAGGSAHAYASWQQALGPEIEVRAVQLPGRGARMGEAPYVDMAELVLALGDLLTRQDRTPFAFFGHSMGALVALELARFCARHAMAMPRHLVVSGCTAPAQRNSGRKLHTLSDDALIDALRDYDGSPPEVLAHRELMELLLPMIRADFQLIEQYTYRPGRQLAVPMTVLVGDSDAHATQESAPLWQNETTGRCTVHSFQGGHFFINTDRTAVLDCLKASLLEEVGAPA